jgi:hypoxanthine phosphoribosyltransferase
MESAMPLSYENRRVLSSAASARRAFASPAMPVALHSGTVTANDIHEVLLTEQQIQTRLDGLGAEIQRDYGNRELTVVAILTGTVMFAADLLRRLPGPLRLDYIGLSSYHGATKTTGELSVTKSLKLDVKDRDVLIVDDILDTGHTLVKARQMIEALGPRSLKCCVFLEKEVPHVGDIRADYIGFRIPNKFVVGYGLDYQERYRNLPFVATLRNVG